MSDLTSLQGSTPVELINETSGNAAVIDSTGSVKVSPGLFPDQDKAKLYSASFDVNLPTGGTQTNMALIRNPSGSGKTMRIIEIGTDFTNTVAVSAYYRLYVDPTVTATGTSQTLTSLARGAGAAASAILVYSGPTTSSVGTRIDTWFATGGSTGSGYASDFDGMLTFAANQDLLITGTPDGTNRNTMLTIWWLEE